MPTQVSLARRSRASSRWVVLDNFEHLVGSGDEVAALAERLREPVVLTSRERLGVPLERCLALRYLPVQRALRLRELEVDLGAPEGRRRAEEALDAAAGDPHFAVRLAVRSLGWRLAHESCDVTMVEGRLRVGERVIDLRRKPRLRALSEALVRAGEVRPGEWLSIEVLFQAGWPGERIRPSSIANRVHVSLSRLRKLGLGAILERDPAAGYRLSGSPRLHPDVSGV